MTFLIVQGDANHIPLRDESVQCVVTSPPYWGLRDYGVDGQLGLERVHDCLGWATGNPCGECYVCHLVAVFREVKRVLRKDGVCWLNLGDSYASTPSGAIASSGLQGGQSGQVAFREATKHKTIPVGLKPKDLVGIPWRVAFALQADGWWLRSDIIWAKGVSFCEAYAGSTMPESVTDRPTKAHEYVFLLTKSKTYYYDHEAVKEAAIYAGKTVRNMSEDAKNAQMGKFGQTRTGFLGEVEVASTRSLRDVWAISPTPYKAAHFATFSPSLVEPMIKAGSSERGCCPRCGAPWERVVEKESRPNWQGNGQKHDGTYYRPNPGGGVANDRRITSFLGWRPTCTCGAPDGWRPDDLEIIASPMGERAGDDPSMTTGRAGYNRPRGDNEGQRPMTRYEQRRYAGQLRNSPHRGAMEAEVGSAFAHYIRTDTAGARPVPPETLDKWIAAGWLERVIVPKWEPPAPIPCIVLDPFSGAGTTPLVADRLGRHGVGLELKREYAEMAQRRVFNDAPLLALMEASS